MTGISVTPEDLADLVQLTHPFDCPLPSRGGICTCGASDWAKPLDLSNIHDYVYTGADDE